jgi:hypothetical protein
MTSKSLTFNSNMVFSLKLRVLSKLLHIATDVLARETSALQEISQNHKSNGASKISTDRFGMNRCGTVRISTAKSRRGPDVAVISRT